MAYSLLASKRAVRWAFFAEKARLEENIGLDLTSGRSLVKTWKTFLKMTLSLSTLMLLTLPKIQSPVIYCINFRWNNRESFSLMLNFLRGRQDAGPDVYDKRLADYNFSASITHGFPTQPTCLDIDPVLNLLAIGEFGQFSSMLFCLGSRLGCIRVYGAPGVEMIGATEQEVVINRIKWLPGRGALAVILEDWSLQIFHIIPLKTATKGEMGLGN